MKRKSFGSEVFVIFITLCSGFFSATASAKKCLYIASYHQGYEWSDGVERGLKKQLAGQCELKQYAWIQKNLMIKTT